MSAKKPHERQDPAAEATGADHGQDARATSCFAPSGLIRILYGVAAVIALAGWWRAFPDTIDDAHITFRYVENLLAGHGLCFNPPVRIEGYSNPLMVFLLVPLGAVGIPLAAAAHAIGLAAFALCVAAAGRLGALLGAARWQQHLARAVVLGHFPLLYYSVTGLETGLFAALIAAAVWRYLAAGERVDFSDATLWLLVALCRPEGLLYPALLGVHELVRALRHRSDPARRASVAWLLAVAAACALFLLWRRWYFGQWLPNTFHAKPMGSADLDVRVSPLAASARYAAGFLWQSGVVLPLLALAAWPRRAGGLWLAVAGGVVFGLYAGGDWMPAARYLLPVYVPLVALGVMGLGVVIAMIQKRDVAPRLLLAIVALVAALALAMPAGVLACFTLERTRSPFHIMCSRDNRDAALAMREKWGTDRRVVSHRIGALGRFSGMQVIDLFGLVDRHIADIIAQHPDYHPIHDRGNDIPELREYIASLRPDLVMVPSGRQREAPERAFYGFSYRHAAVYPLGSDQSWHVYERID